MNKQASKWDIQFVPEVLLKGSATSFRFLGGDSVIKDISDKTHGVIPLDEVNKRLTRYNIVGLDSAQNYPQALECFGQTICSGYDCSDWIFDKLELSHLKGSNKKHNIELILINLFSNR